MVLTSKWWSPISIFVSKQYPQLYHLLVQQLIQINTAQIIAFSGFYEKKKKEKYFSIEIIIAN